MKKHQQIPWISPLHYLNPKPSPSPPPQPPLPSPPPPPSRFLSHADCARLISQSRSPQRALDIFNSAAEQNGFNHSNSTFSALLLRLARSRLFPAVSSVLNLASQYPVKFHESLILSLVPLYSRSKLYDEVLNLFCLILPITRSKPSVKALSICLNLLIDSNRFDLAEELLDYAENSIHIELNTCIYNIVIKYYCCCNGGDIDSAFRILETMRQRRSSKNFAPNLITYSTIISGLCQTGRLKDAFNMFEDMIGKDGIVPDALTYNVLIDGFCRNRKVEKAKAIFEFMLKNGCEPNAINYSTLMGGFCREGRLEEAQQVFDEMQRAGYEPDTVAYTTLISCFCRTGRVDDGIELVKEMKERGCKVDTVTYNVVIEGMCREERFSEVMAMLENLPFEGVRLNVASYRIVMNRLLDGKHVDKAVGLLGLMLGRGLVPHYAASNKLLVSLCNCGRVADATVALYGLAEMGFMPEFGSWTRLVESVSRERKLKLTLELLDNVVLPF